MATPDVSLCPSDAELHRFHTGELPEPDERRIELHLAECSACAGRDRSLIARHDRLIGRVRQLGPGFSRPATEPSSNHGGSSGEWANSALRLPTAKPAIEGYDVIEEIHRGGQGVVFRALQRSTHRQVAIKLMREGPLASPRDMARFEREVRILAQLRHPHIVTIHDRGTCASGNYYVMDYVAGQSLDEWIGKQPGTGPCGTGRRVAVETVSPVAPKHRRDAGATIEPILRLFVQICEAVHSAHVRGIIHRDLKPSNIRITPEGEPRVLDFGLAKSADAAEDAVSMTMTRSGHFLGSLPWASPEQAEGNSVGIGLPTDVYALGVMMFQMLTGRFPYDVTASMRDVLTNILHAEPPRPSTINPALDDEIDTIVLRCLSKQPVRRYASAGDVARDLAHYLAGEPIEAKRDSAMYMMKKSLVRHRAFALTGVAVFLLTLGFAVIMSLQARRLAKERDKAVAAQRVADQRTVEAETSRRQALAETERQRRAIYQQKIALARSEYDACRIKNMAKLLRECPEDLRGWEWQRLARMSSVAVQSIAGGGFTSALSADRDLIAANWFFGGMRISSRNDLDHPRTLGFPFGGPLPEQSAIPRFALSPRGDRLAVVEHEATLSIVDITRDRVVHQLPLPPNHFGGLAFSPDGRQLVVAYERTDVKPLIEIIDVETAAKRLTVSIPPPAKPSWVSFSPEGETVYVIVGDAVQSWTVRDGVLTGSLRVPELLSGTGFPLPGQRIVLVEGQAAQASLWDFKTQQRLQTFRGHTLVVRDLDVSKDERLLVSGSRDQTVRLWEMATGRLLKTFRGHRGAVNSVTFLPGARQIISSGDDGAFRTWNIDGDEDASMTWPVSLHRAWYAAVSPDGKSVAAASDERGVALYDAQKSGPPLAMLEGHGSEGAANVAFAPDGRRLLTCGQSDDKRAAVWDIAARKPLFYLEDHQAGMPMAAWTRDGKFIVTGSWDHTCRVWDGDSGRPIHVLPHKEEIWDLALSPDSRRLISGGKDHLVYLWDIPSGKLLRTIEGHTADIDALTFNPEGRRIASGGFDGTLMVHDAETGEKLLQFKTESSRSYGVVYTPDNRRILTAGIDLIEVWDAQTGERVHSFAAHEGSIYSIELAPNGTDVLTAGGDGRVKLWKADALAPWELE